MIHPIMLIFSTTNLSFMKRPFFKISCLIGILVILIGASCSKTVVVHQNQQSYNDYKAHKYKKLENKTKPSKYSKKKKKW